MLRRSGITEGVGRTLSSGRFEALEEIKKELKKDRGYSRADGRDGRCTEAVNVTRVVRAMESRLVCVRKALLPDLHVRCPNEDNEKSRCALLASVDATLAANRCRSM
jgi:hypothetical protein